MFRVRNVVKGFAQLPGIDYKESFAPVVSNTTERITSAIYLWQLEKLAKEIHPTVRNKTTLKTVQQKWVRKMLDVVAAFLMGLLDEDIYIELPIYFKEFMSEIGEPVKGDVVAKLERSQYGLVHATRMCWKKLCSIMYKLGVKRSKCDPCLFYKHDDDGNLIFVMPTYVDDTQAQGKKEVVEEIIEGIKRHVEIKQIPVMEKFLSVNYHFGVDEKGIYQLTEMKDYLESMIKEYEKHRGELKYKKCPAKPGQHMKKYQGDPVDQSVFRTFVGKVLFAQQKNVPVISNAVRALTTHLTSPGPCWKGYTWRLRRRKAPSYIYYN